MILFWLQDGVDAPPEEDFSHQASKNLSDGNDEYLNLDGDGYGPLEPYSESSVNYQLDLEHSNGHAPEVAGLQSLHLGEDHSLLHSMRVSNLGGVWPPILFSHIPHPSCRN